MLGAFHKRTLNARSNLAIAFRNLGRYDEAEQELLALLNLYVEHHRRDGWLAARTHRHLGTVYTRMHRYEDAERALLEALPRALEFLGPESHWTKTIHEDLINLYEAWGKPDRADEFRS